MKTKGNNSLGTESIGKLLFKMSLPCVAAQLVQMLYNVVDRMYVGRIPGSGSLALAGLGVTFPITMFIGAFSAFVAMGGAPRASIAMGKNDYDGAEKILGNSFTLLVALSVILSILFMVIKEPVLLMFGASENTLPYAIDYLSIYLIGTIFVQLSFGLNIFITNQGYTLISMLTVCIGCGINIILDPIFIFKFNMGVKGAAVATIISQSVSAIWVLRFLVSKKSKIKIRPKNMILSSKVIIAIVSLGISPFVMQATECAIQLVFNRGMATYGNDSYVAIMSILFSLGQVVFLPISGTTQGCQPIIGYNYGARNVDRVKKSIKLLFITCMIISVSIVGVIELFPKTFIGLFTNDAELIALGVMPLRIFLFGMFIFGAQCACQNAFLALGEAKISLFLALLRKVILLVPLAIILPKILNNGVFGVFLAEPISDIIAAVVTTGLFYFKSKDIFKRIEREKVGDNLNQVS